MCAFFFVVYKSTLTLICLGNNCILICGIEWKLTVVSCLFPSFICARRKPAFEIWRPWNRACRTFIWCLTWLIHWHYPYLAMSCQHKETLEKSTKALCPLGYLPKGNVAPKKWKLLGAKRNYFLKSVYYYLPRSGYSWNPATADEGHSLMGPCVVSLVNMVRDAYPFETRLCAKESTSLQNSFINWLLIVLGKESRMYHSYCLHLVSLPCTLCRVDRTQ